MMSAPRKHRLDIHGWIILDKPVGMTSTHAVSIVKRLFTARRAGHAGTLDPLTPELVSWPKPGRYTRWREGRRTV